MHDRTFYRCARCGNIVGIIQDGGGALVCCGEPMQLLVANTSDGAQEKHVPVPDLRDGHFLTVRVGSAAHPMTEEHYIQWIMVCGNGHTQRVELQPGCKPEADFYVFDGADTDVYAYCNLHGLWHARIQA